MYQNTPKAKHDTYDEHMLKEQSTLIVPLENVEYENDNSSGHILPGTFAIMK